MATSSSPSSTAIQIPPPTTTKDVDDDNGEVTAPGTVPPPTTIPTMDRVMSSVTNLAQLLPTGTVLAYQALSPSFTNHGKCETSNQWLTVALVAVLTVMCLFFSFTDSIVGRDGKLYYGVATPRGLNVFDFSSKEERQEWSGDELRSLHLRPLDFVHSLFAAVLFLTVAFSDVGLQDCFFPDAGRNAQELLKNLPLGMALLSTFVFTIFPTKRKGIGFSDTAPRQKVDHLN
ncbi:protein DMP10-like [Hordeum vulgare subsp. vulgare]|uniref:protein DMP10-like n=1 Tax=Hordeum vulgare subsp. vulgare TaxID=112509 RepID=UPI001D1A523A|nr:protein DMP10-like [Hordeum vulgare subsp. vulgare]